MPASGSICWRSSRTPEKVAFVDFHIRSERKHILNISNMALMKRANLAERLESLMAPAPAHLRN